MASRMAPKRRQRVAQRFGGRVVQVDLGAALTVEGRIRLAADSLGVDQEQSRSAVRQCGADDQRVGAVAGQYRVLASADGPRIALLHSTCGDFSRRAAVAGFQMREGQQPLTRGDLVQQFLLRVAAQFGDQRTGRQRGVHDGFGRQPAADFGEHRHDLELPGLLGVEPEAQDPDVGELAPHLAAPAEIGARSPCCGSPRRSCATVVPGWCRGAGPALRSTESP